MDQKKFLYTETMADLFRNQGLYEKAGEIYRYLLEQNPSREGVAAKLQEVETRISHPDYTASLLARWIQIWIRYRVLVFAGSLKECRNKAIAVAKDPKR
jgi:hypothetical protein